MFGVIYCWFVLFSYTFHEKKKRIIDSVLPKKRHVFFAVNFMEHDNYFSQMGIQAYLCTNQRLHLDRS